METVEATVTPDLSWVTAAGGPELTHDGRNVTGLPEKGWWVWPDAKHQDQSAGLGLKLHAPWREPVTGQDAELLIDINPIDEGVRWSVAVMVGKGEKSKWPCRARGIAATFAEAHKAAVSWRPLVQVIDGLTLWTDPCSGEGELELSSGLLSWWDEADGDGVAWNFKHAGLDDLLRCAGAWSNHGIRGESDRIENMLEDVSAARERIRSAMRKFLLNF